MKKIATALAIIFFLSIPAIGLTVYNVGLSSSYVPILILLLSVVLFYYFNIYKHGGKRFWRLVAKHPDKSLALFMKYDCWKVFRTKEEAATLTDEWTGPFRLNIPQLGGEVVFVYGRHPEYFERQEEFERELEQI